MGKGGDTLASAREVSVSIATDKDSPHHLYTLMGAMQWGQFLDHDLDLTAISTIATEATGAFNFVVIILKVQENIHF